MADSAVSPVWPLLARGTIRFAIAATLLALIWAMHGAIRKTSPRTQSRSLLVPSLLLGITLLAAPYACSAWASTLGSGALAPAVYAALPLAVALFEGEGMTQLPALIFGLAGVALMTTHGFSGSQGRGVAVLLLGMLLNAFSLIYAKRSLQLRLNDLLVSSALQCLIAALLLAVLAALSGQWRRITFTAQDLTALSAAAGLATVFPLPAMYWLLQRTPSVTIASLQWFVTFVAVGGSAFLLRARPGWQMFAGMIITLAAGLRLLRPTHQTTGDNALLHR